MVVGLYMLSMYADLLRLSRGGMYGSYNGRANLPPKLKHLAMPIAPIASSLQQSNAESLKIHVSFVSSIDMC